MSDGVVIGVARSRDHRFSKVRQPSIDLVEGFGVADDAHGGVTVKHRSRVAVDPTQLNLRQVHLIHAELFDELKTKGFDIDCAALGENITTRGIYLLALPRGARLAIGANAVVEVTGLRNPCAQIERYRAGLLAAVLDRSPTGELIRKAGVMGVVRCGGTVSVDDPVAVQLPPPPHRRLERV